MSVPLPKSRASHEVLYLAFRAACLHTIETLHAEFSASYDAARPPGFLEQIPIVSGCASQVQLAVLCATWRRVRAAHEGNLDLSLLQQCVLFCALEQLARAVDDGQPSLLQKIMHDGPLNVDLPDRFVLTPALRAIQVTWPFSIDVATVHENAELLSFHVQRSGRMGVQQRRLISQLLELVGQWKVSDQILSNAAGLLNARETTQLHEFFQHCPGLLYDIQQA
ncbi:MAG: hypothetical protein KDA89_19305 [Planctomycetaceae bacterium]|nr:hypothetical protein [Planctomycetaceae bacterium]